MCVLYSIDITDKLNPTYAIDNSSSIGTFDRVAYQMELLHVVYGHQIVRISMNPFTDDVHALGIPSRIFDQQISNVSIKSNVPSLHQGQYDFGRIEFSPDSYSPMAFTKKIDSSGECMTRGYMQFFVNDTCIFAFNNFNDTESMSDLGIGNSPMRFRDWSFTHNSHEYIKKTLHVFVKPFMYTHILSDAVFWKPCYSLDIPLMKQNINYNFDAYNFNSQNLPFDRIGYAMYVGNTIMKESVWVSIDAFTRHQCDAAIPLRNTGTMSNRSVSNLHIISSKHGSVHKLRGHIRRSPYDYISNQNGLLGYSDTLLESGDYGCFQIYDGDPHLIETNVLMSYNNFFGIPDIGIGNFSPFNKNWTLAANGHMYDTRRIEIATRPCRVCYFIQETHEMDLLYSFHIPIDGQMSYKVNNYDASIKCLFTRVGYFIELNESWMYVSFDWNQIDIPLTRTRHVKNATLKCFNGTDINSLSDVWIRFTSFEHMPVLHVFHLSDMFSGNYGCIQIGYKDMVMWSISNRNDMICTGFYNVEQPVITYSLSNVQIFINRHEHIPDVIFLVTGQSNSQGTGGHFESWNSDDNMNDNILAWNSNAKSWDVANLERYMGTKPLHNQCFAFHFAKKYIKRYPKRKIGLIICGAPGQSISRWSHIHLPKSYIYKLDTGDIFDQSVMYTKEALQKSNTKKLEGILWHQGESDFNESHEYYRTRLISIILEYRRLFNDDTLFIAGELLKYNDTFKQNVVLRELNHNKDMFSRCAFSKNLEHCGDELHFSTHAHRELGDMYFEQYMIIQYMK